MNWQTQLEELLELEEGLSAWEIDNVLDPVAAKLKSDGNYQPNQWELGKLAEIYEERIVQGRKAYK